MGYRATWEGMSGGGTWAWHASAFLAGHDAPLVGERAATCGQPTTTRPRRTTRLGSRTLVDNRPANAGSHVAPRHVDNGTATLNS
jgi:hypothetical protein